MAQAARLSLRMQKELKLLLTDPPPGASFPLLSSDSDLPSLSTIHAQIEGPEGTIYAEGVFSIKIQIPERYPFQPPSVTFATPIYHPNIDTGGRICLDILNLPPKGAWQPSLNISTVLTSIGLLLSEPNPDDGLMCEASKEYKYNRQVFEQKARAMTEKYAKAAARGENSSNICAVQNNFDLSTVVESKISEESKHEVNDFGSSHKLSLVSPCPNRKRVSDGEVNGSHCNLVDMVNCKKAGGETEVLKDVPDKGRPQNPCGSRRKLSLQSTVKFHKNDAHRMEIVEPKKSQNASTSTFSSKSMESKKLCLVGQSMLSNLDARSRSANSNDNVLVVPEQLPSRPLSNSSLGPLPMAMSVDRDESHLCCNDPVDRMENSFSVMKPTKVCSMSGKLSLRLQCPSQVKEDEHKENALPTEELPIPNLTTRKTGIGKKLSLTELKGSNGSSEQVRFHSQQLSTDTSQNQQANLDQNSEISEGIKGGGEESLGADSVIVLDSEESEVENKGSIRSKLSLVRKRKAKQKSQTLKFSASQ